MFLYFNIQCPLYEFVTVCGCLIKQQCVKLRSTRKSWYATLPLQIYMTHTVPSFQYYCFQTMGCLSRLVLQITMNKIEPWILEPWHISASFRKSGFVVPEHAIEMPPIQIKGPDLSLQDKEFYITVTVSYIVFIVNINMPNILYVSFVRY